MNFDVVAYLPIKVPIAAIYEPAGFEYVQYQRSRFVEQLGQFIEMHSDGACRTGPVSFEPIPLEVEAYLVTRSRLHDLSNSEFLKLCVSVDLDVDGIRRNNHGQELADSVFHYFAANTVTEALEDALLVSELCCPGAVNTQAGIAICEGSSCGIDSKVAFHVLVSPIEGYPNWPKFRDIEPQMAYRWASKVGYGLGGYAKCRIGRSFAAFTHAVGLTQYREGEVLFRSMQGLEAFYCDGSGDLRKQLKDKSALWLGDWREPLVSPGKLYDIRSKFVHGSSLVDFRGYDGEHGAEDSKASREASVSSAMALRLLIATLQRCINEDVSDVTWTVQVETRA